ncbi:MAG: hypothetical protein ACH255_18930 [Candidatus Thiodiazotropha sp.]
MKLMTRFELAVKETQELHALYRELFNALSGAKLKGIKRTNALATLQNIQNELVYRSTP